MDLHPENKSGRNIKVPNVVSLSEVAMEAAAADKTKVPDETVASVESDANSQNTDLAPVTTSTALMPKDDVHHDLRAHIGEAQLALGKQGQVFIKIIDDGNPYLLSIGSGKCNHYIRQIAKERGLTLKAADLKDINEILKAHAETDLQPVDIYLRIAPYQNGIEIDLGDSAHTVVRITPEGTKLIPTGSETLFYRSNATLPFSKPAEKGNLKKLYNYLNNIRHELQVLLIAWISYTLAHSKNSATNYVILALIGGQGTGKSFLCKLIARLIDPSKVGLQIMPKNPTDLVVAAQNAHVLFYDNIREISETMSDTLCVCATGGYMSKRMLYTDSEQSISHLHAALVLNGIFEFITQGDLAQRSLIIHLTEMDESNRQSESELEKQLEQDMPEILQGLFELIADIFKHLAEAKVVHPERMIDFSRWLAAMELVHGAPPGTYQSIYSECLNEAQLNSLLENPLASAIYQFADRLDKHWNGRPSELLHELNDRAHFSAQRSVDWPKSPESLSKRLKALSGPLKSQGVFIEFKRGKHRTISIITAKIEEELY